MGITRIKPTKRKDLAEKEILILAEPQEVPKSHTYPVISHLSIKKKLPEDLQVYLKVKQNTIIEHINCGTIGNIKSPKESALKSFADPSVSLSVTVQIIDPVTKKVNFSNRKPIKINLNEDSDSAESPICFAQGDIAPDFWKLDDINETDKPTIRHSNKVVKDNLRNDPVFLASILPVTIEMVLSWIWDQDVWDTESKWIPLWKDYIESLGKEWHKNTNPHDEEAKETWIQDVKKAWLVSNSNLVNRANNVHISKEEY